MAEGPTDFIHPIIQAIIASRESQARMGQLAEEKRSHQAEESFRNQQLTQAQTQFELRQAQEAKVQQAEAEFKKAEGEHLRTQQALSFFDSLRGGSVTPQAIGLIGGKYNPAVPITPTSDLGGNGVQAPAMITLPGGQSINVSDLPSPEKAAAVDITRAGGIATAQESAKLPFEMQLLQAKGGQEKELAQLKETAENLRTQYNQGGANTRAELERQAQVGMNNARVGAELFRTNAEYGLMPSQSNALYLGAKTGESPVDKLPKPLADRMKSIAIENGDKLMDSKSIDELKALDALSPIYSQMAQYANSIPSSKLGALASGGAAKVFNTNQTTAYDNLRSNLNKIATSLEGFTGARPLSKAFEAESNSFPKLVDTREQVGQKLKNFNQLRNERISQILSGVSPEQRALIGQRQGIGILQQPSPQGPSPQGGITHVWTPNGIVPTSQGQQ